MHVGNTPTSAFYQSSNKHHRKSNNKNRKVRPEDREENPCTMISSILYAALAAIVFILDVVKFCYKLTKISCSWLAIVTVLLIVVLSRYFRLKRPPSDVVDCILGNSVRNTGATHHDDASATTAIGWWPMANRAACLDSLENSRSAIEKCIEQKCNNILLDVEMTKCGQLVILHRRTLKRIESNISCATATEVQSINFEDLKSLNIAKNHPFCEKQSPESVLHFDDLMQLLNVYETMNVFVLVAPSHKQVVERFCEYIGNDENRMKRLIVCSRSPILIYQLRKTNPNLICGLWLDKTSDLKLPALVLNSSMFAFAYGILVRNLIACVTGISIVFINKHDFNAHTSQIWQNAGIRPIVYTLNSPSEKRYFQQTLRTQYLTDSLRSEPHNFIKANK